MKPLKSILLVAAGLCWFLFAAVIGLMLIQYFTGSVGGQGAGLLGLSSLTVAMGLGQLIGFIAAACLCVIIGVGLCVRGLVPPQTPEKTRSTPSAK
jgi:hypothetical protein